MATGYRHWTNSDLSANNTLKDSRGSPQLYEKTNIINTIIKKPKQNKNQQPTTKTSKIKMISTG